MSNVKTIVGGKVTAVSARNAGGDGYFEVVPGHVEFEDIMKQEPDFWGLVGDPEEDEYVDYALEENVELELEPGLWTFVFHSSESGDYSFTEFAGHVEDTSVQHAHIIKGSESWWGYNGSIEDPNSGVDYDLFQDCPPNIDRVLLVEITA